MLLTCRQLWLMCRSLTLRRARRRWTRFWSVELEGVTKIPAKFKHMKLASSWTSDIFPFHTKVPSFGAASCSTLLSGEENVQCKIMLSSVSTRTWRLKRLRGHTTINAFREELVMLMLFVPSIFTRDKTIRDLQHDKTQSPKDLSIRREFRVKYLRLVIVVEEDGILRMAPLCRFTSRAVNDVLERRLVGNAK